MQFWETYKDQLGPLLIALLSSPLIVKFWPRPKAKLTVGIGHQFVYLIPNLQSSEPGQADTLAVTTARYRIANESKKAATGVTALFNWEPRAINLAPLRPYESKLQGDRRFVVQLGTLLPSEEVNIEIFADGTNAPGIVRVHAEECAATEIQLCICPVQNSKLVGLSAGLRVLGVAFLLMWSWQVIQYIFSHAK